MAIQNNISPSPNDPAEKELKASETLHQWAQKHRGLIEVFLDAHCIIDLANNVIDFNVAFTELCGESYRKIQKIKNFCDLVTTEYCPHQCPAKQIVVSGKTLRLDELSGSSKAYPHLQMILGGVPIHSDEGEIIGSLITIRNVSAESELQKKYDERKKESVTDGLTRLFNKVFTEGSLLRMVKAAMRDSKNLSVCMVDIDHFKKVNDTYGHQAGDYVLALIAQMLKGETRESDIVGRFGGEEFMVLLANSDIPGAKVFVERFRNRVGSTQVMFEGEHIPITVSLGTATFNEKSEIGPGPDRIVKGLVNRADTALYFAKANGRNQSCQYETLPHDAMIHPPKDGDH